MRHRIFLLLQLKQARLAFLRVGFMVVYLRYAEKDKGDRHPDRRILILVDFLFQI